MRTIVDGEERVYEEGESFEVPAGTPHQIAAEGPFAEFYQELRLTQP